MSQGLVLFSHGSLLCGSERLLNAHVQRIRDSGKYCVVEAGYLNYSNPAIEVAIEYCRSAGANEIIIVPYFLVTGKFVTVDLPARLKSVISAHPGIKFHVARALEDAKSLKDIIINAAEVAVPVREWQADAIRSARKACELRPDCPLYKTALCMANSYE